MKEKRRKRKANEQPDEASADDGRLTTDIRSPGTNDQSSISGDEQPAAEDGNQTQFETSTDERVTVADPGVDVGQASQDPDERSAAEESLGSSTNDLNKLEASENASANQPSDAKAVPTLLAEEEIDGVDNGSVQPPADASRGSSRGLVFAFSGCGCLTALLCLCAGIAALGYVLAPAEVIRQIPGAPVVGRPESPGATASPGPFGATAIPGTANVTPGVTVTPPVAGTPSATPGPGLSVTPPVPSATISTPVPGLTVTPSVTGTATRTDGFEVKIVQVARLNTKGERENAGQTVFGPDNRGFAGQVQFVRIPISQTGLIAVIWERVDGSSLVPIRPPETFAFSPSIDGTSWWYAYRAETGLPVGTYQFTVALAGPDNALDRKGSLRFEVRPSR